MTRQSQIPGTYHSVIPVKPYNNFKTVYYGNPDYFRYFR